MHQAPNEVTKSKTVHPEFVDEQMGLPVVLLESVYAAESGDASGIVVPDIENLEAAMAVARVSDEFKLNGQEIKFLRRAMSIKAADLAKFLDVSAETISRWETGKEPISTNPERVLRMRVYNTLKTKTPGVKCDLNSILEMKYRTLRVAGSRMVFRRILALVDDVMQHVWHYEGMRAAPEAVQRLRA
jgi:DNA-binding transcriptional regulator YiaG